MLHSYGPGTTGWITFHKVLPAFAEHYRCIVMDLPNFGRTGPVVYNEPLHNLQARTAVGLMDVLGIDKAHLVGNSQGGQSAMVLAAHDPHRVDKLVFGACHIRTGGDLYLMGNRPSEGSLVTREVRDNPTRETACAAICAHTSTITPWSPMTWSSTSLLQLHRQPGPYQGRCRVSQRSLRSRRGPAQHKCPQPDHLGALRPDVRFRDRDRGSEQPGRLTAGGTQPLRPLGALREA